MLCCINCVCLALMDLPVANFIWRTPLGTYTNINIALSACAPPQTHFYCEIKLGPHQSGILCTTFCLLRTLCKVFLYVISFYSPCGGDAYLVEMYLFSVAPHKASDSILLMFYGRRAAFYKLPRKTVEHDG